MRKVLIVCNDLPYFKAHRENVALALAERGDAVVVAAGNCGRADNGSWPPHLKLKRLTVNPHRFDLRQDWQLSQELRKIIETEKPDLVHAITIKPILYSAVALFLTRHRPAVVWTFPGLGKVFERKLSLAGRARKWIVGAFLSMTSRRVRARATFENAGDLDRITSSGIIRRDRAHLLPGTGLPMPYKSLKRLPRPSGEKLRVLMATRLLYEKGVDTYLQTAGKLGGRAFRFALAGPIDPTNPDSVELSVIEKAQSSGAIEFLGMLNAQELREQLVRTDVFCLPSRLSEGFPRSLMEAAAAGCCLVATDQPGMRSLVIDKKTGRLLNADETDSLAQILAELADNPESVSRMGATARQMVDELGLWEDNVIAQMMDVYAKAETEQHV